MKEGITRRKKGKRSDRKSGRHREQEVEGEKAEKRQYEKRHTAPNPHQNDVFLAIPLRIDDGGESVEAESLRSDGTTLPAAAEAPSSR